MKFSRLPTIIVLVLVPTSVRPVVQAMAEDAEMAQCVDTLPKPPAVLYKAYAAGGAAPPPPPIPTENYGMFGQTYGVEVLQVGGARH